jgi:catechol 2,3-dioxygenase-like lactoylglutathione lyase family enzyme
MGGLVGINHVALEVGSLEEALAWWERVFGPLELRGRMARMAFIDLGDQFVALAEGAPHPERHRHIGLVVDDQAEAVRRAREAGARVEGHDVIDPWGNRLQLVDYRDVQFTKAPWILEGMGLDDLEKSDSALEELRAKGLVED